MRRLAAALLLAPVLSVAPLPAAAPAVPGVVVEIEVRTQSAGDAPEITRLLIEGQNLKVRNNGSGDEPDEMIFKGATREMIVIDHGRRSYTVIDEATLKSLAAQMNDMASQMEAALANVPPEQRAMVEQMMRGRMGGAAATAPRPTPELRATNERSEHSGYPTRRYDVFVEDRKTREFWVTEWSNVESAADVRGAFESMSAYMKDLMETLSQGPLGRNLAEVDQNGFSYMAEMDGFPIVTNEYSENGTLQSVSTVKTITSETIAADQFNPPAGYTRQAMGG